MAMASNPPKGFGIPKAISPVADVQGASPGGVTYQDNDPVGAAGGPVNDKTRAQAISRRLQAAVQSKRDDDRNKGQL